MTGSSQVHCLNCGYFRRRTASPSDTWDCTDLCSYLNRANEVLVCIIHNFWHRQVAQVCSMFKVYSYWQLNDIHCAHTPLKVISFLLVTEMSVDELHQLNAQLLLQIQSKWFLLISWLINWTVPFTEGSAVIVIYILSIFKNRCFSVKSSSLINPRMRFLVPSGKKLL